MNVHKTGVVKRKWVFGLLAIVLLAIAVVIFWRVVHPSDSSLSGLSGRELTKAQKWKKFKQKYIERVSFPREYDGQPSPDAPPEKREKIVDVHSRHWRNFSEIDQVRFKYSSHRFHTDGRPKPSSWDMDAQVEMRYGYGIEVEGKRANGEAFHVALNPEGRRFPEEGSGDLSSLMLSMFQAFRAKPGFCQYFVDCEENVSRDGAPPGKRYDVLVRFGQSDMPGADRIRSEYWFDRATGMLDRIEHCDPKVKDRYGYHAYVALTYAEYDGIWIPTSFVGDYPNKDNKFVEEYRDVEIRKLGG